MRLALLARGAGVKRVVFVNRRVSESCSRVVQRFEQGMGEGVREREGWAGCEFGVLTPEDGGYEKKLGEVLREADVIFCCTPSMKALFDGGVLATEEGRKKGRLVVAIGSYTPEMREIPGELIREAIGAGAGPGGREAGVVVVDTIEGALIEAGELIEEGVKHEQLVE